MVLHDGVKLVMIAGFLTQDYMENWWPFCFAGFKFCANAELKLNCLNGS